MFVYRNDDDRLAQINAVFRTIDLATLSLAPLSAGLIFDLISTYAAAYFIAGWNLVSVTFEYILLRFVHYSVNCLGMYIKITGPFMATFPNWHAKRFSKRKKQLRKMEKVRFQALLMV